MDLIRRGMPARKRGSEAASVRHFGGAQEILASLEWSLFSAVYLLAVFS